MNFLAAIFVVLVDQISKELIIKNGYPYRLNTGGAFSFFGNNRWFSILSLITFVTLVGYWIYLQRNGKLSRKLNLGFTLMVGGAFANTLDRWLNKGVIDFIQIWILPTFNFADISIFLGVIFILSLSFFHE